MKEKELKRKKDEKKLHLEKKALATKSRKIAGRTLGMVSPQTILLETALDNEALPKIPKTIVATAKAALKDLQAVSVDCERVLAATDPAEPGYSVEEATGICNAARASANVLSQLLKAVSQS